MLYYDRYDKFRTNDGTKPIPGITIPISGTDKSVIYKQGVTRFDKLSQEYYGNPYHGWLILLANQKFGGMEFDIPNGEIIRIPFPFNNALELYTSEVNTYIRLYGE